MKRRLALVLAGGLSVLAVLARLAPEREAAAAAQPPCTPALMTPRATSIPANLPAFAYAAESATPDDVHLYTGSPQTEIPLTVGATPEDGYLAVKPTTPLVAGAAYRLEFNPLCSYGSVKPGEPIAFTAAPEAPLPAKLGDATAAPSVTLKDYGTTAMTISAAYTLADEMTPWSGVYQFVAVVDGSVLATKATVTGATVSIQATGWCDEISASKTTHTIALRGRLPFAPTVETAAADVAFVCPAPNIATPGGASPSAPPGSPNATGGGGGGQGGGQGGGSSGTSSCSVSHQASTLLPLAGLAVALVGLVRRRRGARPVAPH
jgi:hypothetical protein